ncbi:MAG: 16S rRNA (cytosine(1402)-N(4))-methyltransferase RsmH [Candidatus Moraniibacteriota bacterium]|nr:MAG: 16S rRNA (cytosine(1402)-N(4))-methyltransferase RsmH [Candidatus Moranbacteria bacterium]
MSDTVHVPVMSREVLEGLNVQAGDTVVDATLGGGGHALLVLEKILPGGILFACDQDREAVLRFRDRLDQDSRYSTAVCDGSVRLVHTRFSDIGEAIRKQGVSQVSAVFADLGLSSDQLNDAERGFSLLREGPIDMRFDRESGETAGDIVNGWTESELSRMFRDFGDVRDAKQLARAIVIRRREKSFGTTTELAEFVKRVSRDRHSSIHPATKVFQALRMAVNHERESLEKFLRDATGLLKPGGRIVVLSFHSGEERTVKRIFSEDARGCVCPKEFPVCRCGKKARLRVLTKRAIVPCDEECRGNPRSRSAKLRLAEKL